MGHGFHSYVNLPVVLKGGLTIPLSEPRDFKWWFPKKTIGMFMFIMSVEIIIILIIIRIIVLIIIIVMIVFFLHIDDDDDDDDDEDDDDDDDDDDGDDDDGDDDDDDDHYYYFCLGMELSVPCLVFPLPGSCPHCLFGVFVVIIHY